MLVVVATALGSLLITEVFIRRVNWLRPLFGMKRIEARGAGVQAHEAGRDGTALHSQYEG